MTSLSRFSIAVLAVLGTAPLAAAADTSTVYRISPGDAVEIGIASISDRTQRAVVQVDGTIVLPDVGAVSVGGLTPPELQTRMQTILPTKLFHIRMPDGREQIAVVRPTDVTAIIAEYRPIYVTGDVLTPGQQAYRPLMTVRQAIAVAGGFSLLRARTNQAGPDPTDLRRDYEMIWGEYTRDYFHSARLRAELDKQENFDTQPPQGSPLSPALAAGIAKAEAEALKLSLDNFKQEQSFVEKGAKDAATQIDTLMKRAQDEADGVKADEEDLEQVTKAFKAGNLTNNRLADVRRAVLLSSSRALETSVELMRTQRQQEDFARQLERNENQRRLGLLNELRDTEVRLADIGTRLRAASQKLQPAGATAAPLSIAGETVRAQMTIVRNVDGQWRKQAADEDAEVTPGDTIEVRFSNELESAAAQ
ncbi:polysaccharide biosynthesis/export family protein [Mesorhizobium sp. B2-7-1]|uniref:polysaccharide biosynthesis/export family protein n=1 Tax=Mesorhizobium sp. B2-7-1 TaxID=2589909 RepID=UPI001125DF72|nr:polysaccharide biosynthesis/export family protein [Mesorhizobium sp. B2-7-1]TPJ70637.1 sugar ABC transporter substrate-binding protein [Mesorhizobium sp. B2-7-1]